jgi:hypothetical protein
MFIHSSIIERFEDLDYAQLKILLFLIDRGPLESKLGLTLSELARACDLSLKSAKRGLTNLDSCGIIQLTQKSKHWIIKVDSFWSGEDAPQSIHFTYDDKDEGRLERKEAEVRALQQELKSTGKNESALTPALDGDERKVVDEIEKYKGIPLTPTEAYYLGKNIANFGPERVKTAFRKNKGARNISRAMTAVLNKGAFGKPIEKKDNGFEKGLNLPEL